MSVPPAAGRFLATAGWTDLINAGRETAGWTDLINERHETAGWRDLCNARRVVEPVLVKPGRGRASVAKRA